MWPGPSDTLMQKVDALYASTDVAPPRDRLFRALELTPLDSVRVVIIGQEPYHGEGQANGLAFAVPESMRMPPSLRNIFKEVARQYGAEPRMRALTGWARQGVLLLNSSLTVQKGHAGSHSKIGWQEYTDEIISLLASRNQNIVFMLWGREAQSKASLIDHGRDDKIVLYASHPSPLSVRMGFERSNNMTQANSWLIDRNEKAIDWTAS